MAAQVFNLGKLRFTYKGAYSGSTEYQLNDVVKYTNNLYVYINTGATTGNAPTNTQYWSKMIDGYTDPASGTNGQFLKTTGTAFAFDDVSEVPAQATHSGKILTTNGTVASWTNEIAQLDITGDFEASKTSGVTLIGEGARADYEDLGTSVKNASNKALTSNVATITTTTAHGFSPFQFVEISLSPADAAFDGVREIVATPTLNTFTFASVSGNISSSATVGTVSAIPGYTNAAAVFAIDANDDFAQLAFRNAGNGTNSSTDIIVYPDNGTDFAGWFSHGVTSSAFNDPEFTITGPNDAYLFYDAPADTTGKGNLVIATGDKGTQNKIIFAAGGLSSDNEQMSITPDQNVHIEITTASTSPTTGALTVVGGVGISGNLNVAGNVGIVGSISFGGGSTTSENLAVNDPIVFTNTTATSDVNDIGIVGKYVSSGDKYAGLVRDASDGVFKLFKDQTTLPTTTVNFGTSSYADLQVAALTATTATINGGITISGTSDIQEMREVVVPVTVTSNTANCDWSAGNIYWIGTAPSANFTVALTNVPTDNNRVMTINVFVTQGATGYIPNALTIAGVSQTIKWSGAAAPTPTNTSGRIDAFTFTLVRVGSAWTVLGSPNLNWG